MGNARPASGAEDWAELMATVTAPVARATGRERMAEVARMAISYASRLGRPVTRTGLCELEGAVRSSSSWALMPTGCAQTRGGELPGRQHFVHVRLQGEERPRAARERRRQRGPVPGAPVVVTKVTSVAVKDSLARAFSCPAPGWRLCHEPVDQRRRGCGRAPRGSTPRRGLLLASG